MQYIYIYIYIYVYTHTYIYIYIYIYTVQDNVSICYMYMTYSLPMYGRPAVDFFAGADLVELFTLYGEFPRLARD